MHPHTSPPSEYAEHFRSAAVQHHAMRMGMWLFLATEVLLFAGLFTAYAVYRYLYPGTFAEASKLLDVTLGTVNTVVLITSSLTVALAVHQAMHGNNRATFLLLVVSLVLAAAFLGIKAVEYSHKFHEGLLPGRYYTAGVVAELSSAPRSVAAVAPLHAPGASMFFTVYFLTTGLHAVHVLIGMVVLAVLAWRAVQGRYSPANYLAVELGGLYWHLVDLVWIFLYPLLYLI